MPKKQKFTEISSPQNNPEEHEMSSTASLGSSPNFKDNLDQRLNQQSSIQLNDLFGEILENNES